MFAGSGMQWKHLGLGSSICININFNIFLLHPSLRSCVVCRLDWPGSLGCDFPGDLGLIVVMLGDNKVLKWAWFHVLRDSVFNLTDLTVVLGMIPMKHF